MIHTNFSLLFSNFERRWRCQEPFIVLTWIMMCWLYRLLVCEAVYQWQYFIVSHIIISLCHNHGANLDITDIRILTLVWHYNKCDNSNIVIYIFHFSWLPRITFPQLLKSVELSFFYELMECWTFILFNKTTFMNHFSWFYRDWLE